MMEEIGYSQERYLASKKAVDDGSLNRKVLDALDEKLEEREFDESIRILEVGAGIGSMLKRLIQWDLLPSESSYTAVEIDEKKVETAEMRLKELAEDYGFSICRNEDKIILDNSEKTLTIQFKNADAFEFIQSKSERYDILIAHAFLDLVDLEKALPRLLSTLRSDGLFYFPITFDGVTIFRPEIDPSLEAKVERVYHESMDRRDETGLMGGNSRTGRLLLDQLASMNAEIISAGSSDWVVYPGEDGYSGDVPYFLHHIINLVKNSVEASDQISSEKLKRWAEIRHRQIENGELIYIAHQLDLLGKV